MKILNIHGYHGSAENAACGALRSLWSDVVSPFIDYDAESPAEVLGRLTELVEREKPDVITGTSYGGFFAAVLCARTGIPTVFVNPCLMPYYHLPLLGYEGDVRVFLPLFGELAGLDAAKTAAIVGGSDEVVTTHSFTRSLLGGRYFRVVPEGKHSGATLPLREFFGEVIPVLTDER